MFPKHKRQIVQRKLAEIVKLGVIEESHISYVPIPRPHPLKDQAFAVYGGRVLRRPEVRGCEMGRSPSDLHPQLSQ